MAKRDYPKKTQIRLEKEKPSRNSKGYCLKCFKQRKLTKEKFFGVNKEVCERCFKKYYK